MQKKLRIFLYIFIGISIAAISFTIIKSFSNRYYYNAIFKEGMGLKKGIKVNMLGIQIGEVSNIELYEDSIIVIFWLKNTRIKQGSTLLLVPTNIFGDKEIVLHQGKGEALPPHSTIYGSSQKGLREAIVSFGTFIDQLDSLTLELTLLTYNAQKAFTETVKGLNETMTNVEKEAVQTLKDVREIAKSTNEMMDRTAVDFATTIENFRNASDHFKSLSETADSVFDVEIIKLIKTSARIDTLVSFLTSGRGTAGRLITDDMLYTKLDSAVVSLKAILDDIKKNPKRYFSIF